MLLMLGISCANPPSMDTPPPVSELKDASHVKESVDQKKIQETALPLREGLVDVQSLNDKILVDLKYSGPDNFTKVQLYFKITKAYLQKEVGEKLALAQTILNETHPDYHLLIYDAIRPREVQYRMWEALDSIPVYQRVKFVSNPRNGSIHNFGAAVDLTICDAQGVPLDMGAGYDDPNKIAYPSMERRFLKTGELLPIHVQNRELLRSVMRKSGFSGITTEWWHFDACSRAQARAKYPIIEKEDDIFVTQ